MYHSVSLIKAIELYTLNGWLISYGWDMLYLKLFKESKTQNLHIGRKHM